MILRWSFLYHVKLEIQGDYICSQLNEDENGKIIVKHHITSGIVAEVILEYPGVVKLKLEFYADESNIDINGDSNDSLLIPDFALQSAIFGVTTLGPGLVIITRYKNW